MGKLNNIIIMASIGLIVLTIITYYSTNLLTAQEFNQLIISAICLYFLMYFKEMIVNKSDYSIVLSFILFNLIFILLNKTLIPKI